MEERILEVVKSIRPDVDFERETALIDDEVLDSFVSNPFRLYV